MAAGGGAAAREVEGASGRRGHQGRSGGDLRRVRGAGAAAEAAAHTARNERRRTGGGTVVGVAVGVGVLVAPPVIVRLTFREVPVEPHRNVTA